MPTLRLFNPENDLALGLDCPRYTPNPRVAALRRRGALLPMWWAEPGDMTLGGDPDRAARLRDRYGLHGEPLAATAPPGCRCDPWGWSLDARRQFAQAGAEALPDTNALARWRQLSHRRTAIELLKRLHADFPLPVETNSADQALRLEALHPGCYIKQPWSGSGRGVLIASAYGREALRRRVEGMIRRQGSVMVERGLDKRVDFAALYRADGQKVEYVGLSVFRTAGEGVYGGNLVATQSALAEIVGTGFDPATLLPHLSDLLRGYVGPLGVDMMRLRDGRVMPCVELNLRRTMGHVALAVAERMLPGHAPFWLTDVGQIC